MAHAEVAYALGIERGLIEVFLDNFELAAVELRLRPLLAFAPELLPWRNQLRRCRRGSQAGFARRPADDAVRHNRPRHVHALYRPAYGFEPMSREQAAQKALKRVEYGYPNLYPEFRNKHQD